MRERDVVSEADALGKTPFSWNTEALLNNAIANGVQVLAFGSDTAPYITGRLVPFPQNLLAEEQAKRPWAGVTRRDRDISFPHFREPRLCK